MLPLVSESLERNFCRALFLALCVAPTVGLAGWTYYQRLPGHRQVCERSLSSQLGLSVQLGVVEHTRPGGMRLTRVELREPERNRLVARAERVEAVRHGNDWWLTLVRPQVDLEGCLLLGEFVERRLRFPAEAIQGKVFLSAADAELFDGQRNWPIRQLAGKLEPNPERMQAGLVFRWSSSTARQPVAIRLIRERGKEVPYSLLEMDSGDAPFPLAALAPWLACPSWLGSESTLVGKGSVQFERTVGAWQIDGVLADVDLSQLVSQHYQHVLEGQARIQLAAQGHCNRVALARGTLHSTQGGTIGRSLIDAFAQELQLSAASLAETSGDRLHYEELALAFELRGDGSLDLLGRSRYAERAILDDRNGMLLWEPPATQDTAGLIRALAGSGGTSLPAGPRAERLVRLLPMPGAGSGKKERAQGQR